ncbi:cytochrome P450 monooxygenase [Arthrobacter sp. RIT-PI-e]|uniref:cytochrome P450 n=1 Tax=Arthrobacter sp. RIT-PI-e TaxID=1681197 RepID=UPI00067623F6|nr:cytochrome P450 [Arthrobacter sp. RIT-PI-e]KNC17838.1 cytochrome P450 monooxygenase [Arthrobacter sp. RIT-PI-e]
MAGTNDTAPVADWITIPDLHRDPFPIYDRLRAEGGVHWVPGVGRYLITSYEAVHATEFDQDTFSANEENSLQIRAMGHSMLRRDDPEHYPERRAWQPVLRPGVVKRVWTSVFERNAERYLDAMIAMGPGADLVRDFAAPYSAENLREILGFHNATHQDLQRWSQTLIDATGNYADDPEVWAKGRASFDEVDIALDEMLRWHARNPDSSLISGLLRIPDYRMPLEKIRANIKMTIGGGLNEPRDAIGVAAWALLTHPHQRRAVEADPSLWPVAFDEAIRWVAPIGLYSRQVTRDTELAGVRLPAGAKLGICVLSANRDETVWDDAHLFDIRREVRPHLAFSKGVHVCLGAWVARAEVATVGLPALFGRLRGIDLHPERPAAIGGWVFRGMLDLPVTWDTAPTSSQVPGDRSSRTLPDTPDPDAAPSIAVVGFGPAGCFSAQAIRRMFPDAEIDVFDRNPVPYGLVRYGVAADHQGTKSVTRQFDRLFTHDGVRFHGGVGLGTDLDLAQLRTGFDAVVLATGLPADARLDIPGARLAGVLGAGQVTRILNGHPDESGPVPALGRDVVVVGQGNVALDLVRLIVRLEEGLHGSDIDDDVHTRLVGAVRTVHVVGRSMPAQAKFDPVMVRELSTLPGVQHVVHGLEDLGSAEGKDARVDAVRALASTGTAVGLDRGAGRIRVEWWFGTAPERIVGEDAVEVVHFTGPGGPLHLRADTVVTAVGFTAGPDRWALPGAHPEGRVEPGLYVAGWLRRGPRGTIPDQRTDARSLARIISEDLGAGLIGTSAPGATAFGDLTGEIDFTAWRRIDAHETRTAAPGRVRTKLRTHQSLLRAAHDPGIALPPVHATDPARQDDGGIPLTIVFGTESGNAELIAEDLGRHLGGRARVTVVDLSDAAVTDLDPSRPHLVVCSTYGDGELPTGVRPFREALLTRTPDLSAMTYAVFGMGDRSYSRTYSRGSELLDEALSSCGARRVGEYGRHDAAGPLEATEVARDWADGVLAELGARFLTPTR